MNAKYAHARAETARKARPHLVDVVSQWSDEGKSADPKYASASAEFAAREPLTVTGQLAVYVALNPMDFQQSKGAAFAYDPAHRTFTAPNGELTDVSKADREFFRKHVSQVQASYGSFGVRANAANRWEPRVVQVENRGYAATLQLSRDFRSVLLPSGAVSPVYRMNAEATKVMLATYAGQEPARKAGF